MHLKAAKYTPQLMPAQGYSLSSTQANSSSSTSSHRQPMNSNNNKTTNHHQFMVSSRNYSTGNNLVSGKQRGSLNAEQKQRQVETKGVNISHCFEFTSSSNSRRFSTSLANQKFTFSSVLPLNEQHDKLKTLELLVLNLVELSNFASEEGKLEEALNRANDALDALNSLQVAQTQSKTMRKQQHSSTNHEQVTEQVDFLPMTTGISMNELSLMVNSNLAAQLKSSGHLKDSIELYTQLCKLATSNMSSSTSVDSRYLLYRFGINIGNAYYEMNEPQKALKYYRLTLDRFSSPDLRSLKIKLMNNIALALMAIKQPKDAIVAWNILIKDNVITSNNNSAYGVIDQRVTATGESATVCNSNHHKFALNLMVCLHSEKDLSSMLSIFKGLIRVGCCHHYKRVIDLDKLTSFDYNKGYFSRSNSNNIGARSNSSGSTASSSTAIAKKVKGEMNTLLSIDLENESVTNRLRDNSDRPYTVIGNRRTSFDSENAVFSGRKIEDQQQTRRSIQTNAVQSVLLNKSDKSPEGQVETGELSNRTASAAAVAFPLSQTINIDHSTHSNGESNAIKLPGDSHCDNSRQLMGMLQEDKLELLIEQKENEISRSILMSCKLMLDLDNSKSSQSGSNDILDNYKQNTSALNVCSRLLTESETYQALVIELKVNNFSSMLERRHKLAEAVQVLKEMEQQVESRAMERRGAGKREFAEPMPRSGLVSTNLCLLFFLEKRIKDAVELGQRSLKSNSHNVKALINLANCYYQLSDLNQAENLYQQALSLDPSCWEANYNLALVHQKLKRPYEKLNSSTKLTLIRDRECFSSLRWRKMILSMIQLALIHQNSKSIQQSKSILDDLVKNSKQSPEVYLLASNPVHLKQDEIPTTATILQQVFKEHPYHLALAERLVVLYIQDFNYKSAKLILKECIKVRPDQVKWYKMLAECHRRAAEYLKAASIYKSTIELFPQDTSCLKALTKLLEELGLNDEKKVFDLKLNRIIEMRSSSLSRL